ncbi:hypothetical protein QYQ99_03035 [Comamonas testosteroni]|uniref:hypothetical protein n=1 Tax=Comamonas testosteroni TaxID=285 RepID=UPI00265F75AB|nr:hypothetical protein [Comamonas testosteroni]WKL16544.1 hypothetical protein QYQ99_03035 [Comamonas testosteroni]
MLTKRTRPYWTQILHRDDGTIGAQHQTITEILDGNTILPGASISEPLPITGQDLDHVLGAATVAALAQVEALKASLAERQSQLDQAQAALADATQALADQRAQLEAATSLTTQQEQVIEAQKATIAALQQQLDAPPQQIVEGVA